MSQSAPGAGVPENSDHLFTLNLRTGPADEPFRAFLEPPTKPDSLGRLAQYDILERIGEGGFGVVLKGFDSLLHRVVAIKMMSPHLAAMTSARQRFLREARAAAAVRNEHVVQIYNIAEVPIPYLVMEYISGESLQQHSDRTGPMPVLDVLRIGAEIARGLAAAHDIGLIHRDIKPANILLENSGAGRACLTDFGLARAADDVSITQNGMIVGTPMYMSPEQTRGLPMDSRADLFSLGSVFYVMVTGKLPFQSSMAASLLSQVYLDTPQPVREVVAETPPWLCEVIAKLHAKKPEDRFQTAREVAELFTERLSQLASGQVHVSVPATVAKTTSIIPVAEPTPSGPITAVLTPERRRGIHLVWVIFHLILFAAILILGITELTGITSLFKRTPSSPSSPTSSPSESP